MIIWYHKDPFLTSPIPQTSFLVGFFFAVSYSKTALATTNNIEVCPEKKISPKQPLTNKKLEQM